MIQRLAQGVHTSLEAGAKYGVVVAMDTIFGQLTMDVICEVAFGFKIHALENSLLFQNIHASLNSFLENIWVVAIPYSSVVCSLPIKHKAVHKFVEVRTEMKQFCRLILDNMRAANANGTLSEHALGKSLLEFGAMPGITEDNVLAEIEIMFIAGHETTAHTLSWLIYSLAKYPHVQTKAHAELQQWNKDRNGNAGGGPRPGTASSIPPYLEAVIKESMRMFPVAAVGSQRRVTAKEGLTLDLTHMQGMRGIQPGITKVVLPQNAVVGVSFYALHKSEYNWGDDAAVFKPERWLSTTSGGQLQVELLDCEDLLGSSAATAANPLASLAIYAGGGPEANTLAFSPFSYGPRNCLGMNLALMEVRIVIAKLVSGFVFSFADDQTSDENYIFENALTLRPKNKLPMRVTQRTSPTTV